jgi:diguanylate cyclase (GGDEF)-like protein
MPVPGTGPADPAAQAAAALAEIWIEHKSAILERVAVLDQVAADLASDSLGAESRAEGERSAHRLAGVLGTFGFARASERGRQAELMLAEGEALGPPQAAALFELVDGMRAEIVPDPVEPATVLPASTHVETPFIAIIDDDPELTRRLALEAGRRGMRVEVAGSVPDGRALVARERPDVVLLDLTFEDGTADAFELLSELADATPPVPVVVLTVRDAFTDRIEVARRGGSSFLEKLLPPSEAIDQVVQILERTRSGGMRLLAVDDDPAVLAAVGAVLSSQGLEVTTLPEPLRFWEELKRVSPALVLLDVDMPEVTGIELCRVLRNDPRWAALPILFLTARQDTETIQQVFAAGGDDYIVKPVVPDELVTRVHNRLDRFRLHQALAETDALTGVANRRTSRAALGQLVRLADRFHERLCLAELDLDRFKAVNDRHGHAAGDAVLRRLGELLLQTFRGEDVVARWGGEEFVVGMYGVTRDEGLERLTTLLDDFSADEFRSGGERFHLSFSAGVAEYPADGADLEGLYRAADEALYRAKEAGRARIFPAVVAAGGSGAESDGPGSLVPMYTGAPRSMPPTHGG